MPKSAAFGWKMLARILVGCGRALRQWLRLLLISWANTSKRQWSVIFDNIVEHRVYHGNPRNASLARTKLNLWSAYFVVPNLINLVYGLRSIICLISFWRFPTWTNTIVKCFLLGTQLFSPKCRINAEFVISLWSTLCITLVSAFFYFRSILYFKIFSIIVVAPDSAIAPADLKLKSKEYVKFANYRSRVYRILDITIEAMAYGSLSIIALATRQSLVYFVGILYNILIFITWATCCSSGRIESGFHKHLNFCIFLLVIFVIPFYNLIVTYYLVLKQKIIIRGLQRVLAQLKTSTRTEDIERLARRRFHRLSRDYLQLSNELHDYQKILRFYVTVLVNFNSFLIVYLTYLIFLDHPPIEILGYCVLVFVSHVFGLLIVLRCSSVKNYDEQISKLTQQYQHYQHRQRYTGLGALHQHLKIDCIVLAMERSRLAFRTLDDNIIDSYFSLQIFLNITKYFFLFFKY